MCRKSEDRAKWPTVGLFPICEKWDHLIFGTVMRRISHSFLPLLQLSPSLTAQSLARHRRIKEKYGQSEFKKMMNRTKFGMNLNFCAAIEAQHSRADDFLLGVSTGRSWGVDPEDNIYSEALDPALKLVLQFSRDWLPWNHYEIPKSVDSQPSCEVAKCQTSFLQLAFVWTGELHPSIRYAADFSCILFWSLQTARRWRSGVWACHTSKENQFLWRLRRSMGPREKAAVVAAISSDFMFHYKASFKI